MNKVIVSKEVYKHIMDNINVEKGREVPFPFRHGEIIVPVEFGGVELVHVLGFDLDQNSFTLWLEKPKLSNKVCSWKFNSKGITDFRIMQKYHSILHKHEDMARMFSVFFLDLMVYIVVNKREIRKEKKRSRQSNAKQVIGQVDTEKKIAETNSEPKPINIMETTYYVTDVIRHSRSNKSFTRKAESWEVCGHPRKLKNGNTIWISPYKKGKGKIKDKTYIVKGRD